MLNKKLLFIVNDPCFFISHRLSIALEAKKHGYDVHIATGYGSAINKIVKSGFTYHSLPITRSGKNLFTEIKTFVAILLLFREIRPQLVHLVTIKPVLYGAIAARVTRIPAVVAAVSGLGFIFTNVEFKTLVLKKIVALGYYFAFGHPNIRVIVQNSDDLYVLQDLIGLDDNKTIIIRGSGVDLKCFYPVPEPEGTPTVILASRMLKDKGVIEFIDAARRVIEKGFLVNFYLIGDPDIGNPSSISAEDLKEWGEDGVIKWKGFRPDIRAEIAMANIVVLPSYREGLPKVLIEAAACGRAVITTNVPGCRDAIEENITGLLVPVKDSVALADAITKLILNDSARNEMGKQGRYLAEREFDINSVVEKHIRIYKELCIT